MVNSALLIKIILLALEICIFFQKEMRLWNLETIWAKWEERSLVGEIAMPRYVQGKEPILKSRILLIPLTNLRLIQLGKKMADLV